MTKPDSSDLNREEDQRASNTPALVGISRLDQESVKVRVGISTSQVVAALSVLPGELDRPHRGCICSLLRSRLTSGYSSLKWYPPLSRALSARASSSYPDHGGWPWPGPPSRCQEVRGSAPGGLGVPRGRALHPGPEKPLVPLPVSLLCLSGALLRTRSPAVGAVGTPSPIALSPPARRSSLDG